MPDLLLGGIGVALQKVGRRHDHPGRAVAALQAVVVPERFLQRVEHIAVGHPLDGRDLGADGLDGENGAALDGLPVHMDGAGAAVGRVTADMRASEAELVAQQVHE